MHPSASDKQPRSSYGRLTPYANRTWRLGVRATLRFVRGVEDVPVEFVRGFPVSEEIGNAVPARVEMEFVRNFQGIERLVQFACAAVEAVGVLAAAIKIDFCFCEQGGVFLGQQEGAI